MIEKGNMTDAEYIAVLEKEIRKRDKKIDKLEVENECLRKDNHIFLEALILSKHKIFGASSEHTEFEDQQSFFNEAELECDEKTEETVKKTVKGYVRKDPKTKRNEIIKNIETEVITCTIPENEQICPRCGSEMKVIGKKYVREEVELIPAKLVVKKYYSNTYGCKKCEKKNMPVFSSRIRSSTCAPSLIGVSVNGCVGDIPKVRQCCSAVPSGKGLGTSWICTQQNNYGKLDHQMQ